MSKRAKALANLKLRAGAIQAKLELTYDFRHNYIPGMMAVIDDLDRFVKDLRDTPTDDCNCQRSDVTAPHAKTCPAR